MSINYSPRQIIDDSLVLYYDVSNPKSFKGKPTTNLSADPLDLKPAASYAVGWGVCVYGGTDVTWISAPSVVGPDGNIINAGRLTHTVGTGDYRTHRTGLGVIANRSFTASIWVKNNGGATTGSAMYIGSTLDAEMAGVSFTLTDKWQRVSFTKTFTGARTETGISVYLMTPVGTDFLVCMSQIEEQPYATPFVIGSRSSTQALLDMTGKRTLTTSTSVFNSSGNIVFNGTDSSIIFGSGETFFPMHEFTMEAWIKSSGLGAGMAQNGIMGITFGVSFYLNGSGQLVTRLHNGTTFTSITQTANLHNNIYHHVMAVVSGYTTKVYIDGVLVSTNTQRWYGTTNWPTTQAIVGRDLNDVIYYFNGEIPVVKIYKRCLSDYEIKQNFNSLRGRFLV